MLISSRESTRITTASGATVVVYVDIHRDADTGEVMAADPVARDKHGNPLPSMEAYFRSKRAVMVRDERRATDVHGGQPSTSADDRTECVTQW